MNRRRFLKTMGRGALAAGAAWGFPTIVSASAVGKGARPAPSNRIVLGAIGLGWMGGSNLNAFLDRDGVQVVALCDIDRDHLNQARDKVNGKYGDEGVALHHDWRELIARGDLDAVTIALPDHWHAIPAIAAAQAGLDIYGEKPFSYSLMEGRAMCEAVKRYGRIWQTGSWQRSTENFHRACELVCNGRIGQVRRVEIGLGSGHTPFDGVGDRKSVEAVPEGFDYEMWLGPAPWAPYCRARTHKNWRWCSDYGGGLLLDWIGHHGDIAHWALGYDSTGPVEISGSMDSPEGIWNAPREYEFTSRYADGVEFKISSQLSGGTKWIGDNGWVFVTRGKIDAGPKSILDEHIGPGENRLYKSANHYDNFLECIRTRRETITPCETAHRSASIAHLCLAAGKLQRPLRWNPETEQFVNDPEAQNVLSRTMRSPWHL